MASPPSIRALAERLRQRVLGATPAAVDGLRERARVATRHARPAAELAVLDRGTLRVWLRYVRPLGATLGGDLELAYTELVLRSTRADGRLGRTLAFTLPDQLARVAPSARQDYLSLLDLVLSERPSALGMVARTLPDLMERLSGQALRQFLAQGLDLHDGSERVAESFFKQESEQGRREAERLALGLPLSDVARTLTLYARAHCGEDVQVRPAPPAGPGQSAAAWSDGRGIFLPPRVDRYGDERDFLVYRVMTARTAGYLEFGTFDLDLRKVPGDFPTRRDLEGDLERFLRGFPNRVLARDLFRVTDDARVEANVVAEYPGVGRDIARLRGDDLALRPALEDLAPAEQLVEALLQRSWGAPMPEVPDAAAAEAAAQAWALLAPAAQVGARVEQVAEAVLAAWPLAWGLLTKVKDEDLQPPSPQGGDSGRGPRADLPGRAPEPERPDPRAQPQEDYGGLEESLIGSATRPEALGESEREQDEAARELREAMEDEGIEATLSEIRRALKAREQGKDDRSYEEMAAFLDRMPAPEGGLVDEGVPTEAAPRSTAVSQAEALDPDVDPNAASRLYPEWDAGISDYKPDWVRLKEHVLQPSGDSFVEEVIDEHGPAIRALRRSFEALRPQALRRVRGLLDGDELDLDRVIEDRVARRAGASPTDRVYSRHLRDQRDVAVAFLVDMSSSTNELAGEGVKPIIRVEKEALVLMAEALEAIGDASAIYGFSGYSREHVAFYVAKDFDDPWDARVRERIGRMSWKMENRDGAAIRHATWKLKSTPARSRLLVLLSDGRPLDCGCDQYYDHYAQEDTRAALREARVAGVHPFCITVDPRGGSYLGDLYGEVGYIVIDRVESLPERLPRIYWRLTR
ncbi:MAG: hypothetical protein H6741_03600 [Alphaproteobacteria bacterium]|nr:hypothetical protein [Alphaproteobacteria bacterium]MCB9791790.1 hypothetical protein [Alphaproteobacteria bacterium]